MHHDATAHTLAFGFLNGHWNAQTAKRLTQNFRAGNVVLAADGGARHALRCNLPIDWIVGDMDSLPARTFTQLQKNSTQTGTQIEQHPVNKDETDTELLLRKAQTLGIQELVLLFATGGRIDMELSHFALLAQPQWAHMRISIWHTQQTIWLLHPPGGHVHGQVGDTISLLPWMGKAQGISTTGLAWALQNQTLDAGSVTGTSNRLQSMQANISLEQGMLLVTHTPAA